MTHRILALLISAGIGFSAMATETRERNVTASNTGELIYTVRLRMPFGKSVWEDSFPATGSNPIRISYLKTAGCPRSAYMNVFVRTMGTTHWQPTTLSGGYDYYKGGAIEGVRFEIDQPFYTEMTCTWKIYSATGLATEPPTGEETLLGALKYPGGFAQNLAIAVGSKMVTHFRLAIPTFCAGVEILEASTVTEGVKDKAKLLSKETNLYSVNDEAGSRISKIVVTANGPTLTACQIPVFIQEK